ncbi:MerR family DNA-binding protein [Microvirga sp. Mcv34]|uniref:MerR family DNA-binding protein n=1 Tax=Microvirga sp. Mcv34 TaxID=2926016 RepID=UPI0021C6D119|nr:MerR family DNA-binding protein [Microvirga sp. Mcv34]
MQVLLLHADLDREGDPGKGEHAAGDGRRGHEVRRLSPIRHARELGFEVDAIRQLLSLSDDPNRCCGEVHDITKAYLAEVKDRIARLTALRDELESMVACDNRRISECRIIEVLADHGQCQHCQH